MAINVQAQDAAAKAAADFPNRVVKIVVPFAPGGTNDIMGRLIAAKMTERLGWNAIVENRGGAGSAIGANVVATSPPDGYTLLVISPTHTIVGAVQKLPYDPVTSFTPVGLLGSGPLAVTVNPSLPVNSIPELIALAKSKPGQLTFASAGTGTANHFATELFNIAANVKMLHIPYKGGGPAITAAVAGEVQVYHAGLASLLPMIRAGKLRALAVTSRERSSAAPHLPPVSDYLPGLEAVNWYGILTSPGVPPAIVAKLNSGVNTVLRDADVLKRLEAEGIEPRAVTPEAAAKFIAEDLAKWTKVGKAIAIAVN